MARVLIVEDEVQVLILAEGVLQDAGHETLTASDKEEALALLKGDELIDLLFTDIKLKENEHGGLELAQEARELRPSLPVLYTTAGEITDGMQALFVDGSEMLPKPYVPGDLVKSVASRLRG